MAEITNKIFAMELLDLSNDSEAAYILDESADDVTYGIFDELASAISTRTAAIAHGVFVELLTKKYTTSYEAEVDAEGNRSSNTRKWSVSFTGRLVKGMKILVEEPYKGVRIASVVEEGDTGRKIREGTSSESPSESRLIEWMIKKQAWPSSWTSRSNSKVKFTKYGGMRANIRSLPGRPPMKRLRGIAKALKRRMQKQGTSYTLGQMEPVGTHSGGGKRYDYVRYAVDKRRSIMNPLSVAESRNPRIKEADIEGLVAEVLIWYWRTGRVRTEMYKKLYSDYDMFKPGVPLAPRIVEIGL